MRFNVTAIVALFAAVASVAESRAITFGQSDADAAAFATTSSALSTGSVCNKFNFPASLDVRNLDGATFIYPPEGDTPEGDPKDCSSYGECSIYRVRLPLALVKQRGFAYFRVRQTCDRGTDYTHNNSEMLPINSEEIVIRTARCKKPAFLQPKSVPKEIVIHFFTSRGFYAPRFDLPPIPLAANNNDKYWDGTVSVYEFGQSSCPAVY